MSCASHGGLSTSWCDTHTDPATLRAAAQRAPVDQRLVVVCVPLPTALAFFGKLATPLTLDGLHLCRVRHAALVRNLSIDGQSVRRARALLPVLQENQREMRNFALQIVSRLTELQAARAIGFARDRVAAL